MNPKLTQEEQKNLKDLLKIIKDKTKQPGQRRIAMAKFDHIYSNAQKRMYREKL